MTFSSIMFDRHSDLRVVWKIILFLLLSSGIFFGLASVLIFLHVETLFAVFSLFVLSVAIATYVMTRYIHHKPFRAVGLYLQATTLREFGVGCLLGFLMMFGILIILASLGNAQFSILDSSPAHVLLTIGSACAFFAVAAFAEELFFRGYLFQVLTQGLTLFPALVIMAAAFSFSHERNPSINTLAFVNIALAGLWLSIAYVKTRSLWLPFGLHFSWNFSQTTLFGFPTSGVQFTDYRIGSSVVSGPGWLTGGDFGPEAGILATAAILLCTWYILKAKYLSTPEGIITLDSLEDIPPPHSRDDDAVKRESE